MSDLPQWTCVCGYMNVGSMCTKCGAIPAPPTMESRIVATLFKSLAIAQHKGASFEIESRNPNGMQGIRILVLDANAYVKVVVPALAAMNVPVEDL